MSTTLALPLAQAAADHWLAAKFPAFTGPKLTWPGTPEIKGWMEQRTIPTNLNLADFCSLEQFAPALKCVVEYHEKLLRRSFGYLAETHELASIEIRCKSEIDPESNELVEGRLFVIGRMLAKPKDK